MIKFTLILFLTSFLSLASTSQTNSRTDKKGSLSTGIGFSGATNNSKSVGKAVWLQLAYSVAKNISVATEFENISYKLNGFEVGLPKDLDGNYVVGNNFSLLLKYYIETNLPLKVAIASGWTYSIKTNVYYYYESSIPPQSLRRSDFTADDYEIPFILEMRYPISKALDVQARVKCNLNTGNKSTYSSGVGLSLKL